jgi:hypothetical protein
MISKFRLLKRLIIALAITSCIITAGLTGYGVAIVDYFFVGMFFLLNVLAIIQAHALSIKSRFVNINTITSGFVFVLFLISTIHPSHYYWSYLWLAMFVCSIVGWIGTDKVVLRSHNRKEYKLKLKLVKQPV